MIAGNIPEKVTIKFHYIEGDTLPFNDPSSEKLIILRPHQSMTLDSSTYEYKRLNVKCDIKEVNCPCTANHLNIIDYLINNLQLQDTLLWIDPTKLPIECIASLIYNWVNSISLQNNISIGIAVNNGASQNIKKEYKLWVPKMSGPVILNKIHNSVWYPSLERNKLSLLDNAEKLNPYDVHPLIDFSKVIVEMGEKYISKHAILLEKYRTRTRHFIFIDTHHPNRGYKEFYDTLITLPRTGPTILNPVLTPGGSNLKYLLILLAGILSKSIFFTPENETPIKSNENIQGYIILRKCV